MRRSGDERGAESNLDVAPLLHRDQAQVVPLVQPANGRHVRDTPHPAIRISLDIYSWKLNHFRDGEG